MIGKLKGILDDQGEGWILIDVGGVGYDVFCSSRTLATLPPKGASITLSIETHVREDHIKLFGFVGSEERQWFRLLQGVQGVGAKVALAILGTLSPKDIADALALQDKAQFSQAPGVGPKVAQRLVTELKDKIPALVLSDQDGPVTNIVSLDLPEKSNLRDAVSALTNLGYSRTEAGRAVALAIDKASAGAPAEELIQISLKELAQAS